MCGTYLIGVRTSYFSLSHRDKMYTTGSNVAILMTSTFFVNCKFQRKISDQLMQPEGKNATIYLSTRYKAPLNIEAHKSLRIG